MLKIAKGQLNKLKVQFYLIIDETELLNELICKKRPENKK